MFTSIYKFLLPVCVLTIMLGFGAVKAEAVSDAELRVQIARLMSQLAELQGQAGGGGYSNTTILDATAECPNINLRYSDRDATTGGQVSRLQNFLVKRYNLNRADYVTGYFGRGTQGLVSRFEADNGLPVTGWVNEVTLTKISVTVECRGEQMDAEVTLDSTSVVGSRNSFMVSGTAQGADELLVYITKRYYGTNVIFEELDENFGKKGFYKSAPNVIGGKWSATAEVKVPKQGTTYQVYVFDVDSHDLLLHKEIWVSVGSQIPSGGAIQVTAPNGGEQWEIGQLNTITWSPYGYNPDVNGARDVVVYLEDVNGNRVGKVMDTGKASLHTYFNLDDYNTFAKPGKYYIRTINKVTGATDRSDAPFTLLPRSVDVKINGSDGPVTLYDNEPITVSLTTTGGLSSCVVSGARRTPGGANGSIPFTPNTTAGLYAYAPANGGNTSVGASCQRGSGNSIGDNVGVKIKNGQIGNSFIKVLSPNGDERLNAVQNTQIKWEMSGLKSVSIALYEDDKWMAWIKKDISLSSALNSGNSYSWAWTPDHTTQKYLFDKEKYKIYITGLKTDGTGYLDDKSDAAFSFLGSGQSGAPTINTVLPKNGSGAFEVGDTIPMKWEYKNIPANSQIIAKLELIKSSGSTGSISGGSWQSPQISGSGSFAYPSGGWRTGSGGYLDMPGTYRLSTKVRQCGSSGCNYYYQSYDSLPVSALGSSVDFTINPKGGVTTDVGAPVITRVEPTTLIPGQGATAFGSNITFNIKAELGGKQLGFVSYNTGKVEFTVPKDLPPGNHQFKITNTVTGASAVKSVTVAGASTAAPQGALLINPCTVGVGRSLSNLNNAVICDQMVTWSTTNTSSDTRLVVTGDYPYTSSSFPNGYAAGTGRSGSATFWVTSGTYKATIYDGATKVTDKSWVIAPATVATTTAAATKQNISQLASVMQAL